MSAFPYYIVGLVGHDVYVERQIACGVRKHVCRLTPDELVVLKTIADAAQLVRSEEREVNPCPDLGLRAKYRRRLNRLLDQRLNRLLDQRQAAKVAGGKP